MDRVIGIHEGKNWLDVFCLASQRRLTVGNNRAGVAELAG